MTNAIAATEPARIGPNAILQLADVLDARLGRRERVALLHDAGIDALPDGTAMVDETPVARLHQALRERYPQRARALAQEAGRRTGDYIIAKRIPSFATALLRVLPAALSARVLARAIAAHAWTFAGSGEFRVVSLHPVTFEVAHNPVVRGEHAQDPVCDWHAQVFERLYRRLVARDYRAREVQCAAVSGEVCRFELRRCSLANY